MLQPSMLARQPAMLPLQPTNRTLLTVDDLVDVEAVCGAGG